MNNAKLVLCALLATGSNLAMEQELARKKASLKLDTLIKEFNLPIGQRDTIGWSLIHKIIVDDKIEVDVPLLEEFKARKGNINELLTSGKNDEGEPIVDYPLSLAIAFFEPKRIRALVACGADLAVKDSAGWTALHQLCCDAHYADAVEEGEDLIGLFLLHRADIHAQAKNGDTPYKLALEEGFESVMKQLRRYKADPFFGGPDVNSLHYVIRHGSLEQQLYYARLWFDIPKKRYLMSTLMSLKHMKALPENVRKKILSNVHEYVPDYCLEAVFEADEMAAIVQKREQEKLALIREIKACLEVKK